MSARRPPHEVLGVAAGAPLDACAAAFAARLAALGPELLSAHAEDRAGDLAAYAELVEAWRALTPAR